MAGLICMMCGEEKNDADGPEEDESGDWWNYCRECDCWTSHPAPSTLLERKEPMTEPEAARYAEKVAQRLFTSPDGRTANLLIQADYTTGSRQNPKLDQLLYLNLQDPDDAIGAMRWDWVASQVKAALMEE